MPTLPWAAPKALDSHRKREAVVMASRFQLSAWRDVPSFLLAALRIRRQMLASPGAIGVSLVAQPLRKTFYTMSAWQDREALDFAVTQQLNAATMTRFRPKMAGSVFTFWKLPGAEDARPECRRRISGFEKQPGACARETTSDRLVSLEPRWPAVGDRDGGQAVVSARPRRSRRPSRSPSRPSHHERMDDRRHAAPHGVVGCDGEPAGAH
jgi:hypothetical protein